MGADSASPQRAMVVLKMKMESGRSQKLAALFAATDDALLRKTKTEQARPILRAPKAV